MKYWSYFIVKRCYGVVAKWWNGEMVKFCKGEMVKLIGGVSMLHVTIAQRTDGEIKTKPVFLI